MSLVLDRVGVSLGGRPLVSDVSLELHAGEVVGLLGPNGAGKTTTFNLVTGLILILLNRAWLKSYGWFMMSAILFVVLIPVQGFLIDADLHLWSFFDYRTGMALALPAEIISVFSQRFSNQAIGITTSMAILAGLSIVLFTTMRPLHQSSNAHES